MKKVSKQKKQKLTIQSFFRTFWNSYAIFFLILLFGSFYSFIGITKYLHFQTGLDIAIYVQTMWQYNHFQLPYVTLYPTWGDLVWADHFGPSLMLLSPFYLLWKDPKILIILQSFIFVSGAYPIYRFAKEKLKNNFFALALAFVFFTYFGAQYPLTFDFHLGTMAASFMAWILWTVFTDKWKTFIVLCIIAAGFKEDMPLYIAAISFYIIVSRRNWKLGLVMLPLSLGYAYIVTKMIMPSLAHNAVKVFSVSYFSLDPQYLFSVFFGSPIKIHTMFLVLANGLFLAFFSGWFFILSLAHFFINFSNPNFPGRWDIYLHYRGYSTSIVLFSIILGYLNLIRIKPNFFNSARVKNIAACLFILLAIGFDVILHLPLNNLAKQQFYYQESWIHDNNEVIKRIPKDAYLVTTNNLSPQLSYRENIFYFPQNIEKTDYLFVDIRKGQPLVNLWLTETDEERFRRKIDKLIELKLFEVEYQVNDALLLRRVKDFDPKPLHL